MKEDIRLILERLKVSQILWTDHSQKIRDRLVRKRSLQSIPRERLVQLFYLLEEKMFGLMRWQNNTIKEFFEREKKIGFNRDSVIVKEKMDQLLDKATAQRAINEATLKIKLQEAIEEITFLKVKNPETKLDPHSVIPVNKRLKSTNPGDHHRINPLSPIVHPLPATSTPQIIRSGNFEITSEEEEREIVEQINVLGKDKRDSRLGSLDIHITLNEPHLPVNPEGDDLLSFISLASRKEAKNNTIISEHSIAEDIGSIQSKHNTINETKDLAKKDDRCMIYSEVIPSRNTDSKIKSHARLIGGERMTPPSIFVSRVELLRSKEDIKRGLFNTRAVFSSESDTSTIFIANEYIITLTCSSHTQEWIKYSFEAFKTQFQSEEVIDAALHRNCIFLLFKGLYLIEIKIKESRTIFNGRGNGLEPRRKYMRVSDRYLKIFIAFTANLIISVDIISKECVEFEVKSPVSCSQFHKDEPFQDIYLDENSDLYLLKSFGGVYKLNRSLSCVNLIFSPNFKSGSRFQKICVSTAGHIFLAGRSPGKSSRLIVQLKRDRVGFYSVMTSQEFTFNPKYGAEMDIEIGGLRYIDQKLNVVGRNGGAGEWFSIEGQDLQQQTNGQLSKVWMILKDFAEICYFSLFKIEVVL